MHELPAGGMAEQAVARPRGNALGPQRGEQPLIDAEGPLLSRIAAAVLGMEVAEIVPEVFGKRFLGELHRNRQHPRLVHQLQPIVAIGSAVAPYPMVHDHDRHVRAPGAWPCAVQNESPVRKRRIDIFQTIRPCLGHQPS